MSNAPHDVGMGQNKTTSKWTAGLVHVSIYQGNPFWVHILTHSHVLLSDFWGDCKRWMLGLQVKTTRSRSPSQIFSAGGRTPPNAADSRWRVPLCTGFHLFHARFVPVNAAQSQIWTLLRGPGHAWPPKEEFNRFNGTTFGR